MDSKAKSFDDYVIESIISNNKFNILEVKNIEEIQTTNFDNSQYLNIVTLIERDDLEGIRYLQQINEETVGYLTIMRFVDQKDINYVVTVFDSDELWQDPQVVDIFQK